jgi:hypothetical protein
MAKNLSAHQQARRRIALGELILDECEPHRPDDAKKSNCLKPRPTSRARPANTVSNGKRPRRCCSAIFTFTRIIPTVKLSVPEVVDFYGRLGFDCICITDHLADPRND